VVDQSQPVCRAHFTDVHEDRSQQVSYQLECHGPQDEMLPVATMKRDWEWDRTLPGTHLVYAAVNIGMADYVVDAEWNEERMSLRVMLMNP
jgi:hypothetical protein